MLGKEEALLMAQRGATLRIQAEYQTAQLTGVARCDTVESTDCIKVRAKFGNGIKAVLDIEEYGTQWRADELPEIAAEQIAEAGKRIKAAGRRKAEKDERFLKAAGISL